MNGLGRHPGLAQGSACGGVEAGWATQPGFAPGEAGHRSQQRAEVGRAVAGGDGDEAEVWRARRQGLDLVGEAGVVGVAVTFDALLHDHEGRPFKCKWYGAAYLKDQMTKGVMIRIHGKAVRLSGEWVFYHPEFEITDDGEGESIHHGRVVPVYPLTESLPQRTLRHFPQMATVR